MKTAEPSASDVLENGLSDFSLRGIARALRSGRLSAGDLQEHCRRKYAELEDTLHAYVLWDEERSSGMAAAADAAFRAGAHVGLLQGIPVSIKDTFGVEGTPLKAGSRRALPDKLAREGLFIGALRRQLSVFTGKTQTDEFAYAGLGTVNEGPTPRNPWDATHHRAAGGSSSGAGISLLQETALVAVATDTSGSIRRPAAWTGTTGLKLTVRRWLSDDMLPLCPTLDTPGILARTVADLRFAFLAVDPHVRHREAAWTEPEVELRDIRLGICPQHFWNDCDPGVTEAVRTALAELERKGLRVIEVDLPELTAAYATVLNGGIVSSEFMAFMEREIPDWLAILQPQLASRLSGPDRPNLSAKQYLANLYEMDRCARQLHERLQQIDVIVSPTLPSSPPALDEVEDFAAWQLANKRAVRNTYVASLLGMCALSLPVGLDARNMPVGMQLIARPWDEERLLAIGCAFERVLGTSRARLGRPVLC